MLELGIPKCQRNVLFNKLHMILSDAGGLYYMLCDWFDLTHRETDEAVLKGEYDKLYTRRDAKMINSWLSFTTRVYLNSRGQKLLGFK